MHDGFAEVVSDRAHDAAAFAFTPEVEADTAAIWDKLKSKVTPLEWRLNAPLISKINRLKRQKNDPARCPSCRSMLWRMPETAEETAEVMRLKSEGVPA